MSGGGGLWFDLPHSTWVPTKFAALFCNASKGHCIWLVSNSNTDEGPIYLFNFLVFLSNAESLTMRTSHRMIFNDHLFVSSDVRSSLTVWYKHYIPCDHRLEPSRLTSNNLRHRNSVHTARTQAVEDFLPDQRRHCAHPKKVEYAKRFQRVYEGHVQLAKFVERRADGVVT